MNVKYVYPDCVIEQIEKYQLKIKELMENHFDNIDSASTFGRRQMVEAIRDMDNDPLIKLLEKEIENLYLYSVPKMVVTSESDEDKKRIEAFLKTGD